MTKINHSKLFTVIALGFGLSVSVPNLHAEPSSLVAFDKPTRLLLKSGDSARGEELSQKLKCTKCHGDAGIAEDDDEVNLAGQIASYTFKQMKDYQDGQRDSRDMKKAMRKIKDDQDIADIAAYYAGLSQPEPMKDGGVDVIKLVRKGDHTRLMKSCSSCHGQRGEGDAFESPALTGQKWGYLESTMLEMREDERTNDVYSRMRIIAKVMTEEEITALAKYYGQKPMPEEVME